MAADLCAHRLVIILGKGGVGRTTFATALATLALRRGLRVFLCEIHGRDRVTHLLGHPPIGAHDREVRPGLWVSNVTPAAALEEYVLGVVRSRRLYQRLFGPQAVAAFVRGLPGLDDLMMIGKVRYLVEEGSHWDLVIVDAPATGNGLYFLQVPEVVLGATHTGPLGSYARRQRDLVHDSARTAIHLVTLAEEMPVVETLELRERLMERAFPLGAVVLNRVRPPPLDPPSRSLFAALEGRCSGTHDPLLAAGRWALGRWELQEHYRAELRAKLGLPLFELCDVPHADLGPQAIDQLADALEAQS
jgi:anion-transporting  ArsA/GET3 family ATPase